jgi:4-hydroxy 2-oxovalerate aldolase
MREIEALDVKAVSFPNVHLLDVTLRDGGFRTDFRWSEQEMMTITSAVFGAGARTVELGYLGGVPELHNSKEPGVAANVPTDLVKRVHQNIPKCDLALMVHPKAISVPVDFDEYRKCGLGMVRFVFHHSWYPELHELVRQAQSSELRVAINIALTSRYTPELLRQTARLAADLRPDILYLADTCSALVPDEVHTLFSSLSELAVPLGFHAHDFLSLALSNSMAAASSGATHIDVSLLGLGRGAGNLKIELWLALAAARGGQCAKLTPLIAAIDPILAKTGEARASDLTSIVCGVLNLSPPQEELLRTKFAAPVGSAAKAAAYLIDNFRDHSSISEVFADR